MTAQGAGQTLSPRCGCRRPQQVGSGRNPVPTALDRSPAAAHDPGRCAAGRIPARALSSAGARIGRRPRTWKSAGRSTAPRSSWADPCRWIETGRSARWCETGAAVRVGKAVTIPIMMSWSSASDGWHGGGLTYPRRAWKARFSIPVGCLWRGRDPVRDAVLARPVRSHATTHPTKRVKAGQRNAFQPPGSGNGVKTGWHGGRAGPQAVLVGTCPLRSDRDFIRFPTARWLHRFARLVSSGRWLSLRLCWPGASSG